MTDRRWSFARLHPAAWAALLWAAGCTPLPQRNPVLEAGDLPQRWAAVSAAAVPGRVAPWLGSFAAPELERLVASALAANNQLAALAARVEQARAQARIEGAARRPQAELAPSFSYLELARIAPDNSGSYWELPFSLSWEVDLWGRLRDRRDAALLEADAVRADLDGAALSLAARTVQSCFELAEARQQVAVVEQSIAERRILVDLVRGRFSLGLTGGLDLSLALTDLNDAQAQLEDSRNRLQTVARGLDLLLGRYPRGDFSGCGDLPQPPAPLPAGVPAELLARRPDIAAAFVRLRSRDLNLAAARKALLPRLTLYAAGGTGGASLADLADPRAAAWNLALGLAQPLYAGGRLRGDIDLQGARVAEEARTYRETVLNACREVEQSLAAEDLFKRQQQALAEAVARTETSRKLAIHSYRNGSVEILTLLDSYRSTLSARSALLAARRRLLHNRVGLYLALGGPP